MKSLSKYGMKRRYRRSRKKDILSNYQRKEILGNAKSRDIMLLSVPGKVLNRVILERQKMTLNSKLRDHQAGFHQKRSCTDQISTLRIIIEQSIEWNSPAYINFIDFEKAFDNLDHETMWKLMRHYRIPEKFISIIKTTQGNDLQSPTRREDHRPI